MSQNERTGWRDEELSRRHRTWGYNVPAVDVDFLMVEYDKAVPVAIVDYKHVLSTHYAKETTNLTALGRLHGPDGRELPFMVVHYNPDGWWFLVRPINAAGSAVTSAHNVEQHNVISEEQWVGFLHAMRNRPLPDEMETP